MPFMFALALAAAPAAVATAPAEGAPPAEAQRLIEDCNAHRFETTISVKSGGVPRQSKVKFCGVTGQSDAEWIGTLRDAIVKVEGNPKMPPSAKEQIISAVKIEIVRLGASVAPAASAASPAPALVNAPALPAPRATPSNAAPQYSALPPFPPPPVAGQPAAALAGLAPTAAAAPAPPPLPRPKLSFTCFSAGDIANGPCFGFDRDTILTARAGEPLKDTMLRFVRNGEVRADYPLPPLAKGRSTRLKLPREVCARVVGGSLTIRIVRGPAGKPQYAQVVGTEGPYNLRC